MAMTNHVFVSSSTVEIYDLSYIHLYSSPPNKLLETYNVTSFQLA